MDIFWEELKFDVRMCKCEDVQIEENYWFVFKVHIIFSIILKFFKIQQGFDVVVVKWVSDSNIFGKYKLEWKFDEKMNQEKMNEIINIDIIKINQQLL
ncbi:MAG TPA: hypothetical protein DCO83_12630 [Mucilaginibacter sp.]|jgi:hypothetical protein|nr:hypothetical protein [Mucilaginibacter sp.]